MSVYERSTRVEASLSAVWDFHSTEDGLVELTPNWMRLQVEAVRGPDGDPDPELLYEGSEIDVSVRPLGLAPRQSWTSRIVERRAEEESARFVDEMVAGPFAAWEHTHTFRAAGDGTLLEDRVEYRLPGGRLGGAVGPAAVVGFEPMFRYRHRRTRALLE
ncbi:cyclase [Halobacteriales archaeon SW_7_71_33]|nr:MAG: cyclase [Halobacteriales archaeon SW_7_71_33]